MATTSKIGDVERVLRFAECIENDGDWDDLALPVSEIGRLQEITKGCSARLTALFHGPNGCGKIIAASLVAKHLNRPLYRIDLGRVVSKYIGESENNLNLVFEAAERLDWVLFFDEADALFAKRSDVHDSHDRFANLVVDYLLERIESHGGPVILTSNTKNNIDAAFIRRLNYTIEFPNQEC